MGIKREIDEVYDGVMNDIKLAMKDHMVKRLVQAQDMIDDAGGNYKVELVGDLDSSDRKDIPRIQPIKKDIEKAKKFEFGSATENIKPNNIFLKIRNIKD